MWRLPLGEQLISGWEDCQKSEMLKLNKHRNNFKHHKLHLKNATKWPWLYQLQQLFIVLVFVIFSAELNELTLVSMLFLFVSMLLKRMTRLVYHMLSMSLLALTHMWTNAHTVWSPICMTLHFYILPCSNQYFPFLMQSH